jgi:glycosyltransferase involved in cell wall biosynthesis
VRITVEASTWTNQRGYGRFLREILSAALRLGTPHTFTLVADTSLPESFALPGATIVRVPLRVAAGDAASATGRRSLPDMWAMSRALTRVPADCLFFPTVYSYVPVVSRVPRIVGIHDVIAERLPGHVFANDRARAFWRSKVWLAARQAALVMTVSNHAADGIARELRVPRARIRIVGEAPAAVFTPDAPLEAGRAALRAAGLAPDTRFFLYVGGIAPHKNLDGLAGAVEQMDFGVRLVIAGDYEHDTFLSAYPALQARVDRGRVSFTGRLEDEAVAALMRLAQALVLPSFDEGFGLPAIEAAACGAVVIVTRNSAMPDVLGDAAIYVDPYDPASLLRAMTDVMSNADLRASLSARAAARAREYTWEAAARQMIAMFEELAS